jgi:hypothetical protein
MSVSADGPTLVVIGRGDDAYDLGVVGRIEPGPHMLIAAPNCWG